MNAFQVVELLTINWIVLGVWAILLVAMAFGALYSQLDRIPATFDWVKIKQEDQSSVYYDVSELSPHETKNFMDRWELELQNRIDMSDNAC